MRILVVEDEAYSRQSLVKQIHALDETGEITVLEASNGQQGLEMCKKERIELVVTDIRMPMLSGIDMLREIHALNPEVKVVLLSGFAEFGYAKEAIRYGAVDYLLKPASDEDLRRVLGKFTEFSATRENKLRLHGEDLLTRHIYQRIFSQQDEPESFVNDTIFTKVFPSYYCLYLQLSEYDMHYREDLYQQMKELFSGGEAVHFRMFSASRNNWILIVRGDSGIDGILNQLAQYFDEKECLYHIALSRAHTQAQELPEAYREALSALKTKVFLDRNILRFQGCADKGKPDQGALDVFRLYLSRGDAESAYVQTARILEPLFEKGSVPALENTLTRLLVCFHEAGAEQDVPDERMPDNSWPEKMMLRHQGREELLGGIERAVQMFCAAVYSRELPDEKSIGEQVLEYIDKNFDKDLSLKCLADKVFHVNSAYLSYLISEQTSTNFSSYLRDVRIRNARALLEDPSLSITDIAILCGYNSTSRFIQVFKKSEGITPKKLRNLLLSNAID